jgi:hypothetical protein
MDLTPEQRAVLEKYSGPHYYGEQDENGVDLSLIRENLKRSPIDRLRRADRAAKSIISMRSRVRRIDPKQA